MVAHKCTPLRNTVRHRQGAAAVVRRAAAVKAESNTVWPLSALLRPAPTLALSRPLTALLRPLSDLHVQRPLSARLRPHLVGVRQCSAAEYTYVTID